MKRIHSLFFLLLLPLFLTACAEVCVRPMVFEVYGRGGEDDMMLPVEIKGVKTEMTQQKINAAFFDLHETSRIAQRIDDIVYRNCERLNDMSEKDKRIFKKDSAKFDDLVNDLTIVLRSQADDYADYKEKLQNWNNRSKEAIER
ncbi:MAG: hypothetical protein HY889_09590 [Deltaproteobacteria bacterium]|nr:hypothetical protein [Deltaproteobacteria bacterium]